MDADAPDERAEALWRTARRAGTGAMGALEAEPVPGVRRAMCFVLAAHGEGARVLEAARSDPDAFVRGTAIQLATRLAAGGALPLPAVLDAIAREPMLAVPALGAIGESAPAELLVFARAQLASLHREIQLEAFEALVRANLLDEARAWMVAQRDVDDVCRRWLRLASAESLAAAFAGTDRTTRARVLRAMHAAPWSAVAALIADDRELLATVASDRGDIAIPATVLARAILAGLHAGTIVRLTQQLRAAGSGLALLAEIRRAVSRADTTKLRDLLKRARAHASALELASASEVLDQLVDAHPVEQLLGLEHALSRWLDRGNAPADLLPLVPELRAYLTGQLARRAIASEEHLALGDGLPAYVLKALIERLDALA